MDFSWSEYLQFNLRNQDGVGDCTLQSLAAAAESRIVVERMQGARDTCFSLRHPPRTISLDRLREGLLKAGMVTFKGEAVQEIPKGRETKMLYPSMKRILSWLEDGNHGLVFCDQKEVEEKKFRVSTVKRYKPGDGGFDRRVKAEMKESGPLLGAFNIYSDYNWEGEGIYRAMNKSDLKDS